MFNFLRKKKRLKEDPEAISNSFLSEFILNDDFRYLADVSAGKPSVDITNKARIYRFAIMLMVLLSEEKKRPELVEIREVLERRFFGKKGDTQGIGQLEYVKGAMKDLGCLVGDRKNGGVLWAKNWLLEAGIEESNPASLALFALGWMGSYKAVVETVQGIASE